MKISDLILLLLALPAAACNTNPRYHNKRPASLSLGDHKVNRPSSCAKYILDYVFKISDKYYAWDPIDQRYCELSDKTVWRK